MASELRREWPASNSNESVRAKLAPMHENWSAALTKRSWLAQNPIRDRYWGFVKDIGYSLRDHEAIRAF
jgi:hypothetical protein